ARNILYTIMRGDAENRVLFVCAETVVKWEKRLAKGKKSQMLPGLTPPSAAENIMGGSTTNDAGMLYNKNNPNKITENGIYLGASAYNYHKGQNGAANMSDMQASSSTNTEPSKDEEQQKQVVSESLRQVLSDDGLGGQIKQALSEETGNLHINDLKEYDLTDEEAWDLHENERKEIETNKWILGLASAGVGGLAARAGAAVVAAILGATDLVAGGVGVLKDNMTEVPRPKGGHYIEGTAVIDGKIDANGAVITPPIEVQFRICVDDYGNVGLNYILPTIF
ncbi:MAG: hypothetical protein VB082_08040, partial [Christensenella sp.]|nr:hypothetical protein [Christensenella sp.]